MGTVTFSTYYPIENTAGQIDANVFWFLNNQMRAWDKTKNGNAHGKMLGHLGDLLTIKRIVNDENFSSNYLDMSVYLMPAGKLLEGFLVYFIELYAPLKHKQNLGNKLDQFILNGTQEHIDLVQEIANKRNLRTQEVSSDIAALSSQYRYYRNVVMHFGNDWPELSEVRNKIGAVLELVERNVKKYFLPL